MTLLQDVEKLRSPILQRSATDARHRRIRKTEQFDGNTRIVYLRDNQLYVGGHVEEPIPTGVMIPPNRSSMVAHIEDVGAGDSDHIVSFEYFVNSVRTIGSYDGRISSSWKIDNADLRLNYQGYGVFTSAITMQPNVAPGTNNTTITESVQQGTVGLLFPSYLATGAETGSRTTRTFQGSGYQGIVFTGVTISEHSYFMRVVNDSCQINLGGQSRSVTTVNRVHASTTLCLRATSGNVEQIMGSQSYSQISERMSGSSGSQGATFTYDDMITGSNQQSLNYAGNFPIPVGRSGILQGTRTEQSSLDVPLYTWQHLIAIPAPYGYETGVDPDYYQTPPVGFPSTTGSESSNETIYIAGRNIENGYYYQRTTKQGSDPSVTTLLLDDGREVSSRLYNSGLKTFSGDQFRYVFNSAKATLHRLVTNAGVLDYQDAPAFEAELTSYPAPSGYISVGASAPVFLRLELSPP